MVQNLGGRRQNRRVISAILFRSGGSRGARGRQPTPHRPRGRHFVLLCGHILSKK